MNQRSRNRRRNPLVLIGQLIKRRNGRRIAQHHGDLSATGNAGGLALGAGLWLVHGSAEQLLVNGPLVKLALKLGKVCADFLVVVNDEVKAAIVHLFDVAVTGIEEASSLPFIAVGVHKPLRADAVIRIAKVIAGGLGGLKLLESHRGHGLLQSGLIPPMDESYIVTSDNATTILQEAA